MGPHGASRRSLIRPTDRHAGPRIQRDGVSGRSSDPQLVDDPRMTHVRAGKAAYPAGLAPPICIAYRGPPIGRSPNQI